jgi:hypothetical protein
MEIAALPSRCRGVRGAGALALLCALCAPALSLLSSCATTGRAAGAAIEPLSLLSPQALAYAEIRGPSLARFAPLLAPQRQAGGFSSALARARSASIALLPAGFEAILEGDYPAFSTRLALSFSKDFKRQGNSFFDAKTGIELSIPRSNLILAATRGDARGGLAPLAARVLSSVPAAASPIPPRYAELSRREILLYAPRPFERLAPSFVGEVLEVPISGLLVAARPLAGGEDRYELTLVFLMDKEGDARVYKPIVKLAWLALARSLFPEEGGDFASPVFQEEGGDLVAPSLVLSGAEIESALRRAADKMRALDARPMGQASGQ